MRAEDWEQLETPAQRTARERQARMGAVQDLMARYWGGLTGEDLQLLPAISDAIREAELLPVQLRLLRLWALGGSGSVGERRAHIREVIEAHIQENVPA